MHAKSIMKLEHYLVERIEYTLNHNFDFCLSKEISINPQFQRSIDKIDEDTVKVSLSISIDNQDTPVPYMVYISIAGVFHLKQWEDKSEFIRNNATAILFPYLRALLSTITANSNFQPYILPIINIQTLFNE